MATSVLNVLAFDGGYNVPIWVAQKFGFFESNGLQVELSFTPNSGALVQALMTGSADIALAGFDNFVAYQEGQGEAALELPPDIFSFMGGDSGFLTLVAKGEVTSMERLKGKKVSVDAMTTGFAFALREILEKEGLRDGDIEYVKAGGTAQRFLGLMAGQYDATLLRTPYEMLAMDRGFVALTTVREQLGHYMGTVGATRRAWAGSHESQLLQFIVSYRAALDWLYTPGNRNTAVELLVEKVAGLDTAIASSALDLLLDEQEGLIADMRIDPVSVQTVLKLRSKYGTPQKDLIDPTKYLDRSYLIKAFNAG